MRKFLRIGIVLMAVIILSNIMVIPQCAIVTAITEQPFNPSSPAVVDGTVYVGSNDGKVYCFSDHSYF